MLLYIAPSLNRLNAISSHSLQPTMSMIWTGTAQEQLARFSAKPHVSHSTQTRHNTLDVGTDAFEIPADHNEDAADEEASAVSAAKGRK